MPDLLDDDVAELRRLDSRPSVRTATWNASWFGHRRLVEHAGGDLDVLLLQRAGDVGRGQVERLQRSGSSQTCIA